ncbi:MAG: PilZ domain-containing protein [Magnetococcales bacterium]|nr:PilZ domain-containing protein [Magnetococcales bacterium]
MNKVSDAQANRAFERLIFFNAITLILPNGREVSGTATDMGHGGAFLELSDATEIESVQIGDRVKLKIELFGRPSTFAATVAHKREKGIGLRLERQG